jgi:AraC-like DNA-binding protein/quercetin dioxygenase-like cupin family protein
MMDVKMTRAALYFEEDSVPLTVIKTEHHDRTNLHEHEFFELVFIDHGVALHSYEGKTQILTAGDVFIILPGEVHSYISTNNTGLYNCLFQPEAVAAQIDDFRDLEELGWLVTGRGRGAFERVHAGLAERQEIVLILEQIIWEKLNRPIGWQLKMKSLLLALLVMYARLSGNRQSTHDETNANFRQILKAVAFIETHFDREVALEEIAKAAGLSSSYLSRQFKSCLGTSPSEYARHFRIAKAAELLRQPELAVADVARKLGFGDIALFSRQFRQVTGTSPTGFRKQI